MTKLVPRLFGVRAQSVSASGCSTGGNWQTWWENITLTSKSAAFKSHTVRLLERRAALRWLSLHTWQHSKPNGAFSLLPQHLSSCHSLSSLVNALHSVHVEQSGSVRRRGMNRQRDGRRDREDSERKDMNRGEAGREGRRGRAASRGRMTASRVSIS